MKKLYLLLIFLIITSVSILGCAEKEPAPSTAPAPAPAPAPTPTPAPAPAPSPAPAPAPAPGIVPLPTELIPPAIGKAPISGGILREVWASGPMCLSYYPEMGPGDELGVMPALEKLMEYGYDNDIHPFLAESVTVAPDGKRITFKIRKGIKFSDGSPLNAEAVAWNYQRADETNKLQYNDRLVSIEVADEYTMVLHTTMYDKLLLSSYGWVPIFSKAAWDKAGSTDEERKVWARANVVGTGPFILKEYKKDDHMTWVKNPDYWQPGKPYLNGYEIKFIPDPVVASAIMEAGEADMWTASSAQYNTNLQKKGFVLQGSTGTPITIYYNNKDAASLFNNKKLREAVEYAIDKSAVAKALGFGTWIPLENGIGPDMWGYDPNYKGREYNVAKAKQLLAEAGYPNGVKVKLNALLGWEDQAQAIKRYLDDAGMETEIDMADPGRFFSMYWGGVGWTDMLLFLQASSPNTLIVLHRTFGPEPKTRIASFVEPEELNQLFNDARRPETIDDMKAAAKKIVDYFTQEALVTALWETSSRYVICPYVHTTYLKNSVIARFCADDWMEKH